MKPILIPLLALGSIAAAIISTTPPPLTNKWQKKQLSRYFWAEGACSADVNSDGHPDILSGPYWFQGPDFKTSHTIYPPTKSFELDGENIPGFEGEISRKNAYSDNFLSYTHDFNKDGRPDYLVIGWPGKETYWYENTEDPFSETWTRHLVLDVTDNESPMLADINGDKQPDLLCMSKGTIGFATYDPKNPTQAWRWHAITPKDPKKYQRYTHGIGHGDINGDGLTDILEATGWWQQPADWDGTSPWQFNSVDFGKGGAQMFGYDVNADGRNDVVTSIEAHGFGVAWFEQLADGTWKRHLITNTATEKGSTGITFSQPHAIDLADIDGNGTLDIVTGKRFWAHGPNGDPEPNEPAVLYAFLLKRENNQATYSAEIIDNDSGVGCQVMAKDINKDNKPDIIVGNKKGTFVLIQK